MFSYCLSYITLQKPVLGNKLINYNVILIGKLSVIASLGICILTEDMGLTTKKYIPNCGISSIIKQKKDMVFMKSKHS